MYRDSNLTNAWFGVIRLEDATWKTNFKTYANNHFKGKFASGLISAGWFSYFCGSLSDTGMYGSFIRVSYKGNSSNPHVSLDAIAICGGTWGDWIDI